MDDLVLYIKKNLKKGYTKESLKTALLIQNYTRMEIDKAIQRVDDELASEAPLIKTKPVIKHEFIYPDNFKVEPESFWEKIKNIFR